MNTDLPLASVRAFALAGRFLSIAKAANELEITPSAVSHHIKQLESHLDTQLMRREGNRIALTDAGQRYMDAVSEGMLRLISATRAMRLAKDHQVVRLATPPGLAMLWLIERVGRFMRLHEEITIAVTSVRDPAAVLESSFDVGFWYGEGRLSGLRMAGMGPNHLFPICHKDLMRDGRHENQRAAISCATLLDSVDESYYARMQPRQGWRSWLMAAGVPAASGTRFLNFTPHLLMHRAVEGRLGIGLSRTLLAADALSSGEIGVPFGPGLAQRATYHLIYPAVARKRKEIGIFRDWILAEAEASRTALDGLLNLQALAS